MPQSLWARLQAAIAAFRMRTLPPPPPPPRAAPELAAQRAEAEASLTRVTTAMSDAHAKLAALAELAGLGKR